MSVGQLLNQKGRKIYQVKAGLSLSSCLKCLNDKRIGSLLVMGRDGSLEGLISERDILRVINKLKGKAFNVPVEKVMTPRKKLVVGTKDNSIHEVMEIMTEKRERWLW